MKVRLFEFLREQINNDFKSIFGLQLEWKPEYEILELAKKINEANCKPRRYMTCGTRMLYTIKIIVALKTRWRNLTLILLMKSGLVNIIYTF